jgi:predicted ATPase
MSQQALAEAARISPAGVSALERGSRQAPYRETVLLLADALKLSGEERGTFERAADDARATRLRMHKEATARTLPMHLGAFVGRTADIGELSRLLSNNRLLTVTGSGGIGKTRIALEVIRRRAGGQHDDAYFVDLAPIIDGTLILGKIASVMSAPTTNPDEQIHAIASALRQRSILLIIDNCEHLIAHVSFALDAILRSCPNVTLIATSRRRIGIPGEVVYRLPSLSLPGRDVDVTSDNALSYGAIELFVGRAQAVDPAFRLTDEHVAPIVDICRRLDGIPLAIEFAAARLPSLGLSMLRARLNERFDLLTGGAPIVPARQQTLRATIAWSCDLLEHRQRNLTSQLSVFADGWTVEAAEATCALESDNLDELLDDLSSLVEQSVVSVDGNAGPTQRYRLLEPIRQYAHDRLGPAEAAALSRRHALWAAALVERWTHLQFVTPRLLWIHELEEESANVRSALAWALGPAGDSLLAARIATGPQTAGAERQVVESILSALDAELHPELAARLWWRVAGAYNGAAKAAAARQAIALFDRIGDRRFLGISYANLAMGLARSGNLDGAEEAINTTLSLCELDGAGNSLMFAFALTDLADVYFLQGRVDEQRGTLKRALSLATALGDEWLIVRLRLSLGEVEFAAGNLARAIQFTEVVVAAPDLPAFRRERMVALCNLAVFRLAMNLPEPAAAVALEALDLARGREPAVVARAIECIAAVSALRAKPLLAARLHGYFEAWRVRESYDRGLMETTTTEILMRALRAELSLAQIASLFAEGAALTEQRAVAEARR